MRQFLINNDVAFRNLEARARGACIRFRNQELPPGCSPQNADIGFEIDDELGTAKLLVKRGIRYEGNSSSVREWLRAGVAQFPSFMDLREWIQGPLKEAFITESAISNSPSDEMTAEASTNNLTDMTVVHKAIRNINRPLYLDESLLFERMKRRVLGQDNALKGLAAVMVRHCARRKPTRPAVIFSVGPSGVGKTRSAEVMAQVLREFDDENNGYQFLRLDMTEYQEAHRVSQLIGAPQGYVGHSDGSQLVDALQANPRTIVLFDEIEKAHTAVLRVLMNAMDAGRLSTAARSSRGRQIDCRYAVFIFTSNLDAKEILDELETRSSFGNRSVEDDVCRRRLHAAGIAPEIIGRIGRFLVYRPLTPEIRAEIVALAIAEIAEEYGLRVVHVEPSVIVELIQKVRSDSFGIRPERFLIDDALGGVFAKAAENNVVENVVVSGPPFECCPQKSLENQKDEKRDNSESQKTDTKESKSN